MSHRAAVYTVQVRPEYKPTDFKPFGDLDGNGVYLGDALNQILQPPFSAMSVDASRRAVSEACAMVGEEVQATLVHGQSGLVADIVDTNGQLQWHLAADQTQLVRCGSLFRLPRQETVGWWAVHVNNTRSVKGLVTSEIVAAFKQRFPKLMLLITPCVPTNALRAAVDHDQLEAVRLIRLDRPNDRFAQATNKWVAGNEDAKLELHIAAGRGARLLAGLIKRHLQGDQTAFPQITLFEGLQFDQAKVEVTMPNAKVRTFNIERPDSGSPFTCDLLDLAIGANGEPTGPSLYASLGAALDDMA